MPITITITDPTPAQIVALFGPELLVAPAFGASDKNLVIEPKGVRPKRPAAPPPAKQEPATAEDAALQAELAADVAEAPSQPRGAAAVVDAGTGKPIVAAEAETEVDMSFDDIKAEATLLAARDMNKLAEILGEFGAGKLSEVPKEQLGEFAARVIETLG